MGASDRERGQVVGIASPSRWPCVGSPDGVMFSCCAEGSISVVALVPAGAVMDPSDDIGEGDPVLVHVTVCSAHVREVRAHYQQFAPEPVWTLGTEYLLDHWDQVIEPIQLPVFGLTAVA